MVAAGGIFVALGWLINAKAASLEALYAGAVVSGIGAGAIYATCVGNAVKWFPDRRGLAVGLTAAGFGAGAAVTVIPIQKMIASIGYADTFFWFALGQGAIIFVLSWLLRAPEPGEVAAARASRFCSRETNSTPGQMLASPVFWLLYVMFVLVSASGLMVAAQVALIAKDYGVAQSVILFGATTLIVSGVIDNVANGSARPFFGWVSDQIGREYTMAIAFTAGGIAYWLLGTAGTTPWTFVICAALIFFTWRRDLQSFPLDLHRHVRSQIRNHQHQPALYGQGPVGLRGSARQCAEGLHRQLARRVRGGRGHELYRGGNGIVRCAADAALDQCVGKHETDGTARRMSSVRGPLRGPLNARTADLAEEAHLIMVRFFLPSCPGIQNANHGLPFNSLSAVTSHDDHRNSKRSITLPLSSKPQQSRFRPNRIDNWNNVYQYSSHWRHPCVCPEEVAMKVGDILRKKTARVATVRMNETVAIAAQLMRASNISALVVKDVVRTEGNTAVGMFTERDVVRAIAEHGAAGVNLKVSQLISVQQLVSCSSSDTLEHVRHLMNKNHIRHLPVIDNYSLIGVISVRDISTAFDEEATAKERSVA